MSAGENMLQRIKEITAANNAASAAAANAQMQFQAEMSNTAHQREVEDLIKAGLNPVLSANYGASTPNGAMAQTDMSGASAYSGYMGALANAGAIMYSADRQYEAQRDFPNSWAGIAGRLIDALGIFAGIRDAQGVLLPAIANAIPGVKTIKDLINGNVINWKSLISEALKGIGLTSGNLNLSRTWDVLCNLNKIELKQVREWINRHWRQFVKNYHQVSNYM